MTVTRKNWSFVLTAANDTITGDLVLTSLQLVGTGMTPGSRLTLTDTDGQIMFDHYVVAANENFEMIQGVAQLSKGLILTAAPTGTFTVLGRIG